MNICRHCRSGGHTKCIGRIFENEKGKTLILRRNKERQIVTSNNCECTCRGIINESTLHFRDNLGPDIVNNKETGK